jgi:uncharacterized membrane protein
MTGVDLDKEHWVDHLIHCILLAGVSISAILLVLGLLIVLIQGTPLPEITPAPGKVLGQAFRANGTGLIYLGLLLLIMTPVARVAMLIYGYARMGWWRFALISLLVLLLLGIGWVLGIQA